MYHITITDTEDGAVLLDADTSAVVGAVDGGRDTCCADFTNCNLPTLAKTILGAMLTAFEASLALPQELRDAIKDAFVEKTHWRMI